MSDRRKDEDGFDVLKDVLETLRFHGTIFFRSDLAAPWGMQIEPLGNPRFHIALGGDFFVGSDDSKPLSVGMPDIILLPSGDAHWLADQPGRDLVLSERARDACELNQPLFQHGTITHRIMCGIVHYDQESSHPILASLPEIVRFEKCAPDDSIWAIIALIDAELSEGNARSGPIVDRLCEVLFLKLLNRYIEDTDDAKGFLAALGDRRVQHALALMHKEPASNWTLDSLGERVGMSRATLVRRFHEAVGAAPMTYLMNWRIMKAFSLAKYTTLSLDDIAATVGFASARSLSKAFVRHYGRTPTALRRSLA